MELIHRFLFVHYKYIVDELEMLIKIYIRNIIRPTLSIRKNNKSHAYTRATSMISSMSRAKSSSLSVELIRINNLGYQTRAAMLNRSGGDETLSFRNADV